MQDNKEKDPNTEKQNHEGENEMAQNPNPRANENIQNTSFDKNKTSDSTPDIGSEITDGAASWCFKNVTSRRIKL